MFKSEKEILAEFVKAKAILKGHFILSSGLHSDTYIQCARVLMSPRRAERLCNELAERISQRLGKNCADIIVSPAMGGVIVGYEVGRQLGLPAVFCERVDGRFQLRRGFEINDETRILVIEDVITTGKSSLETFECLQNHKGKVVGVAALIDRTDKDENIEEKLGVPVISLLKVNVGVFEKDKLPASLKNIPASKPGSRHIKSDKPVK